MPTLLPDRAQLLLRYGDVEGTYDGDGSRVIGAIVMTAVNTGCNREYVRSLLADPQHRGGFCALRRRRRNLDGWFDREWTRAIARAKASPAVGDRHEATMRATELAALAESMEWPGVGGGTDRVVYLFALRVAARAGRLSNLALSARQVAEEAKVSSRTASKSLNRLGIRGLLRCTTPSKGKAAAVWQIVGCDTTFPHLPTPVLPMWDPCGNPASPPSDTWRYRGLGHSTERLHALLSEDALSPQGLADALGVTKRTVQRHLAKLAGHQLAQRTEDGWIRGDVEPVDVEEELGVKGMTEKQHEDHVLERKRRAKAMAEHASHESAPFVVDPETGEVFLIGELLGPAKVGANQHNKEALVMNNPSDLDKRQRHDFRIGELLGPAKAGSPTGANQHGRGTSTATEVPGLTKDERHDFRKMADHRDVVAA